MHPGLPLQPEGLAVILRLIAPRTALKAKALQGAPSRKASSAIPILSSRPVVEGVLPHEDDPEG